MATIDPYSVISLPMQSLFGETVLSTATGFVWKANDQHYLVTNWHVVTGIHPETGKHLSEHAGEPDRLTVYFTHADDLGKKTGMPLKLFDDDGTPRWLVHPNHDRKVDVVALPIKPHDRIQFHPINEQKQEPVASPVGSDVFVIGFPLGVAQCFPIWKRASMASEPELRDSHMPFLIDTATRPGMSGSPVICRADNYLDVKTGVRRIGGVGTRFIGVYSGRVAADDALAAQLGLVWPENLLEEVIAGGKRDVAA